MRVYSVINKDTGLNVGYFDEEKLKKIGFKEDNYLIIEVEGLIVEKLESCPENTIYIIKWEDKKWDTSEPSPI